MMFNGCGIVITLLFLASFGECDFGHKEHSDVMRGYLLGLTVKQADLEHLISCFHEDRAGRVSFTLLMDKIDKIDYKNLPLVAETFTKLLTVLKRDIIAIDLCTQQGHAYDRLFRKIYNTMGATLNKRLMLNFISNPQQITKDIEDAVDNYIAGRFKEVGRDIGDVMHILLTFAVESPSSRLDDCLEILGGFFSGLKIDQKFVSNCFDKMRVVLNKLMITLQRLNNADIFEILEILGQLYQEVMDIILNWSSCESLIAELKTLIDKILNTKVIEIIIKNYTTILEYMLKAKDAFVYGEYRTFGEILGSLLQLLFIT